MDENRLFEILHEIGLSRRESEIFLFISRKGPQKVHEVATNLGIDRVQTYRSLISLREKGMVEATIEASTRYIAVPIEPLIESFIKTKKSQVAGLEAEKDDLINYFKSISIRESEYPIAKLQAIIGKNRIYSKILQMVDESKKEVLWLTTSLGLIQMDTDGSMDKIIELMREKKDIQFKMLTNISKENMSIIKSAVKRSSTKNTNVEWRHIDLGSRFYQRFVIKDEEESLLYLMSRDDLSMLTQEDTGLWITSKMFVSTLRVSFLEIWRDAVYLNDRVNELETGIPVEETVIIRDKRDAQKKIENVLETTKKEAILISSSTGIHAILENDPFRRYARKGVKFYIMAPIDLENFEAAERLSKLYQIKHVPISYLTMMIADNKHLFIFKTPPLEEDIVKYPFYLRNTFYTNDQKYVERTNELLNDIWKRGTLISEIGSGRSIETPEVSSSDTILEVSDIMLKKNVRTVIVSENNSVIGIIDQRDILEKVLKTGKDPKKTMANEIMSTPIMTIDSEEPLIEALKTIKEKRIPRLAVMKKGNLIAVLT